MRRPPHVRPFPWAGLDSSTHEELALLRGARHWAGAVVRLEDITRAVEQMLSVGFRAMVRRAFPLAAAPGADGAVSALLVPVDDDGPRHLLLLEAEPALAVAIAARATGRSVPQLVRPGDVWSPSLGGACAAVITSVVRRVHAHRALRVVAVGPAASVAAHLQKDAASFAAIAFTVLLADEAYAARAVIHRDALRAAPAMAWTMEALSGLGALRLTLPLVASAVRTTTAELLTLRCGDALVVEPWTLTRSDGRLCGRSWLCAPHAEVGVRVELVDGHRIVLRGEVEPFCTAGSPMDEAENRGGLLAALGDVPVVVRVEIGEATLAAREWAALRAGDVIALGGRIGDPVVVRVGGIALARGELVDVEGEVAVRIIERIGGTDA